ncbi:unnamed protein product [Blepharisma stoltei]|uniref:Uncharacterized protein n=1 Tax=Blepharisma stoltei TaxID=1481888 RepID=A0AAU9IN21_9CILI|nr:unnamed protein product [Blepharisma stoltei]
MSKRNKAKNFASPKIKYSPSIHPLPADFANQVLDLEIQVETQESIEAFKSLIELYSQAIEYYESIGDAKYKYYQERMIRFIQKEDNVLVANTENSFTSPEKPTERHTISITSRQLFNTPPENPFELAPETRKTENLTQKRVAERVIKQHDLDTSATSKEIQLNLDSQDIALEHRISSRKKNRNRSSSPRSPNKFGSFNYLDMSNISSNDEPPKRRSTEGESDKSGGVPKPLKYEIFEKELENIMEKYVLLKIKSTHQIRKKYKEQIQDVKGMGNNEIIKQLVGEMEKSRQQELDELERNIDEQRKEEIRKIKEEVHKTKEEK